MSWRKRLIEKLLTPELKDEIYKELWDNGKRIGKLDHEQRGRTTTFKWSNNDKIIFELPYKAVANKNPSQMSTKVKEK